MTGNFNSINISAKAKVNISLSITGVADGYHLLDMVSASVALCDTITVTKREDDKITFSSNCESLGYDNTATKAAQLFCETFKTGGVDIKVDKVIPMMAGLGGSSADAAGVLNAMKLLFHKNSMKKIDNIALQVGCDVPYMINGGFARVKGKGEIIEPFEVKNQLAIVIAKPLGEGVSTAKAFSMFDSSPVYSENNNDLLISSLMLGKIGAIKEFIVNDLLAVSNKINPKISETLLRLQQLGAVAVSMSGSGSAVFGIFDNYQNARQAEKLLKDDVEFCVATTTL